MRDVLLVATTFAFLVAVVALSLWAVNDARRRGKSALIVWVAAVLFFPWGLIAWLLFRPARIVRTIPFPRRAQAT
jgi:hypothetical protein